MDNYKLEVFLGSNFNIVTQEAKELSLMYNTVEFEFNGITCLVDKNTDLSLLRRDYNNAHLMEWETIGTNCVENYDEATIKELEERSEANRIKWENYRKIEEAKDAAKKALVEERIANITLKIKEDKQELFDKAVEANSTEAYGLAALNFSINWGKLMQFEIDNGKTVAQCAEETSDLVNYLGISGFQYGYAYALLRDTWVYGEELKQWKENK